MNILGQALAPAVVLGTLLTRAIEDLLITSPEFLLSKDLSGLIPAFDWALMAAIIEAVIWLYISSLMIWFEVLELP